MFLCILWTPQFARVGFMMRVPVMTVHHCIPTTTYVLHLDPLPLLPSGTGFGGRSSGLGSGGTLNIAPDRSLLVGSLGIAQPPVVRQLLVG